MRRPFLIVGLSLLANVLFCLTILPYAVPPFQGYALSDIGGVLLWQGIAVIGWPIALLGLVLSLPFGARLASAAPLLFMVVYPAALFLLLRMAISRRVRPGEAVLLNLLVTVSFAVLWYYVLNGYDFMVRQRRLTPVQRFQEGLSMIRLAEQVGAYRLRLRRYHAAAVTAPELSQSEALRIMRSQE